MLLPILIFVFHFVFGIELRLSVFAIVGIGAACFVRAAYKFRMSHDKFWVISHPIVSISAIIVAIAAAQGGVEYYMYLSDDFKRWTGIAKQVHAFGVYEPLAIFQATPAYTPGWPLIIGAPSILSGTFDPGQAALLPMIMHLSLIGILFDMMATYLREKAGLSKNRSYVLSWVFILSLLMVEASGQVVTRSLMSEPPQVYGMTAVILLCLISSMYRAVAQRIAIHIGIILTALYLIKVTALSLVPALLAFITLFAWTEIRRAGISPGLRLATSMAGRYFAGTVIILILWKVLGPLPIVAHHANPSMLLAPERLMHLFSDASVTTTKDWLQTLWAWLSTYKSPLTIVSVAGLVWASWSRRYLPVVIIIILFIAAYVGAQVLYQVEFWGSYINSVPRFNRVGVRAIHVIGLLLFAFRFIEFTADRQLPIFELGFRNTAMKILLGSLMAALCGWQIYISHYRFEDLRTRSLHRLMPMMRELTADALAVRKIIDRAPGHRHRIVFLNDNGHSDDSSLVFYHLIDTEFGAGPPTFILDTPPFTWRFGDKRALAELPMLMLNGNIDQIDIIWPFRLNDAHRKVLGRLDLPPACKSQLDQHILIAKQRSKGHFECLRKPAVADNTPVRRLGLN